MAVARMSTREQLGWLSIGGLPTKHFTYLEQRHGAPHYYTRCGISLGARLSKPRHERIVECWKCTHAPAQQVSLYT